MIKGLYSAFSSMEAAWRYQDALANNVANATTVGYKREVGVQQSFADVLLSQQTPTVAPIASRIQQVVGQIGTGSFLADLSTDFRDGNTDQTQNPLDFALDQGFFQIEGEDGTQFYTRDGHFARDGESNLVDRNGHYVLDVNGQPITLPPGRVTADSDGALSVDGQPVAHLAVLDFAPGQLTRAGAAHFTSTAQGVPITGAVRQGFLEGSNTDIVEEMTTLLAVQRVYQANQTVIARLDGTLDQAAGQLGRFGA